MITIYKLIDYKKYFLTEDIRFKRTSASNWKMLKDGVELNMSARDVTLFESKKNDSSFMVEE